MAKIESWNMSNGFAIQRHSCQKRSMDGHCNIHLIELQFWLHSERYYGMWINAANLLAFVFYVFPVLILSYTIKRNSLKLNAEHGLLYVQTFKMPR